MQTKKLTATGHWQQLTDGSTDCVIQVTFEVDICRSPTPPPESAPCLKFSNATLTIAAPDIAWVRTTGRDSAPCVPVLIW